MKKILLAIILSGIIWMPGLQAAVEPFAMKNRTVTAKSPELLPAAKKLAAQLGKIYGHEVPVGENGTVVLSVADLGHAQAYELQTSKSALNIRVASAQAADYAVAGLLQRLGYRYYFPMENWEIIPAAPPAEITLDVREKPDYLSRRIWPGWGLWPDYRKATNGDAEWNMANRLGGITLNTGHIYGNFIRQNRKEFEAHPEYYALYQGERKSSKLCISNPGLRKLFCDYVLAAFQKDPKLESFSADPSDGGGWCECEACVALGSPSDRAVMLANAAAEAVNAEFPGKLIGMYAYNMHSPPPSIKVHPQVVINVATAFIKEGWTVDQLIDGWNKQGATIGIREYYYAGPQPGVGRGTDSEYLERMTGHFYRSGAHHMTAEASDAWAPGGLEYYIAANRMWDTKADVGALKDDFFRNAFSGAETEMRQFYQLLDGSKRRPLNADLLGRMYRTLDKARAKASGPAEAARIDDMICYARFCELLFILEKDQSWENYTNLMKFGASIRPRRLVHTYAMYRDNRQLCPPNFRKQKLELDWQNTVPPTAEELTGFVKDGIAAHQLLDFEPVEFSKDLRPVVLDGKVRAIDFGNIRRFREFYVWSDGKPVTLEVTGGLIKHYRNRGNVVVQLIQIGGHSDTGELETLIQEDRSVAPDGEPRQVTLTPKHSGLHRITVNDNGDMTSIKWPDQIAVGMPVDLESAPEFSGTFYFYVPAGTKTLGYYAKLGRGRLISPDGKTVRNLSKTNGFYSDPVPAGMDGKVWELRGVNGVARMLTVPSILSLNPNRLLLPNEIVKEMK
jgi:hypothetical protein